MITNRKTILFLSIPLLLILGGLECEDECTKCEDAINHMADKIEGQACNPNTMQKAWDRIREDCDHFDSAVGLMAETCFKRNLRVPDCKVPVVNLNDADIEIVFEIRNVASFFPFEISVNFFNSVFSYGIDDFRIDADGSAVAYILFNYVVAEGEEIEVVVRNLETDEDVAMESVIFSFDRKNDWQFFRTVDITYDSNSGDTQIVFSKW